MSLTAQILPAASWLLRCQGLEDFRGKQTSSKDQAFARCERKIYFKDNCFRNDRGTWFMPDCISLSASHFQWLHLLFKSLYPNTCSALWQEVLLSYSDLIQAFYDQGNHKTQRAIPAMSYGLDKLHDSSRSFAHFIHLSLNVRRMSGQTTTLLQHTARKVVADKLSFWSCSIWHGRMGNSLEDIIAKSNALSEIGWVLQTLFLHLRAFALYALFLSQQRWLSCGTTQSMQFKRRVFF